MIQPHWPKQSSLSSGTSITTWWCWLPIGLWPLHPPVDNFLLMNDEPRFRPKHIDVTDSRHRIRISDLQWKKNCWSRLFICLGQRPILLTKKFWHCTGRKSLSARADGIYLFINLCTLVYMKSHCNAKTLFLIILPLGRFFKNLSSGIAKTSHRS